MFTGALHIQSFILGKYSWNIYCQVCQQESPGVADKRLSLEMPQCDIDFYVSKYPGAQVHMMTSILLFHNMALEVKLLELFGSHTSGYGHLDKNNSTPHPK